MKRTSPLRRTKPVRKRNATRLKKRRAVQFGAQAQACREMACCVCGAPPPSHAHHTVSRGAGGLDADCAPLCHSCHHRCHGIGWQSFETLTGVDLRAVARELQEALHGAP